MMDAWVSDRAYVAAWVYFGKDCLVHPFALVGKLPSQSPVLARPVSSPLKVVIGDGVEIGPHSVIYDGVTIGNGCFIGDGANIRENATIGNNCVIGQGVSISHSVVIGDNVRIMDNSHICGECRIGSGTFMGGGIMTANDRRREVVDYKFVGLTPPVIGERCLIGSAVVILPGVTIGDGAVIGMGALVVKHVPAGKTVLGTGAVCIERPMK
jgi:acetyltransferase-like isoleucine patch superfamily enzyme